MRLETLLPRPLDPCGGSECATLMGALIAAIHLDRRRARALGWRGVRPSGSLLPAWTCRVAGSGLVFGLVFFGEDADGGALRGTFAAYAFPLPDDPLLEVFPLEALRHKPLEEESGLPVLHILTGFLGSGKTTFLRQWLDFLHGRERYTGVIQNEFGEIGLDAALLRGETQVEALDEGCVCCSLADSLRPGLLRLIGDMPAEQFILETTGLANPANVMEALSELRDIVQPGLVITVADALDLCRSEGDIAGIRRAQAARADVIILNKADTVEPAALEALAERLRALNRQALILPARHGAVAFAELDAFYADWADRRGTPLPSHRPALPRFGETVTHADEGFVSAALRLSAPLDEAALLALLDGAGPGLCRAKGVVDLRLDGGVTVPATVQYAAGRMGFEPAPEGEERYLVFIGTDISLPEAPSS